MLLKKILEIVSMANKINPVDMDFLSVEKCTLHKLKRAELYDSLTLKQ